MAFLLTRSAAPTVWPLAVAVLGAATLAVGVSPRSVTVSVLAVLLVVTAAINDVAARQALRRTRRTDPDHAFDRIASGVRRQLDRGAGLPVLAALLLTTIVGAGFATWGIGGNWGVITAGIAAATFGTWSLRILESAGDRANDPRPTPPGSRHGHVDPSG